MGWKRRRGGPRPPAGAPGGGAADAQRGPRAAEPPGRPPKRHLLSVADLTRDDVERLLGTARTFAGSLERHVKKLPTLKGHLIVNLFYESSTRTSSSFELAAKRLSARNPPIKTPGPSRDK